MDKQKNIEAYVFFCLDVFIVYLNFLLKLNILLLALDTLLL